MKYVFLQRLQHQLIKVPWKWLLATPRFSATLLWLGQGGPGQGAAAILPLEAEEPQGGDGQVSCVSVDRPADPRGLMLVWGWFGYLLLMESDLSSNAVEWTKHRKGSKKQRFGWSFNSHVALGNPEFTIKLKFNHKFPPNQFISAACYYLNEDLTHSLRKLFTQTY